jgi:hypothetical protein
MQLLEIPLLIDGPPAIDMPDLEGSTDTKVDSFPIEPFSFTEI